MVTTDLHYFGCLSYYNVLAQHEHILFNNTTAFSKMSFKNRMVIATAQGPLHLTIPIVGGRDQKTPINEIFIANDSPWKAQHFKSIYTSYKRAPYFEYYADSLKQLYQEEYGLLSDFLLATQHWVKLHLKAKWAIKINSIEGNLPDAFNSVALYKPNNFQTFKNISKYQQVFEDKTDFISNACVIDLLFAIGGKASLKMLQECNQIVKKIPPSIRRDCY